MPNQELSELWQQSQNMLDELQDALRANLPTLDAVRDIEDLAFGLHDNARQMRRLLVDSQKSDVL